MLLLIASQTFFRLLVVPSFLVRKVENKSFPCTQKLGERTGQVWQDNSRGVRTHEKNSGETVSRLGTIIQSIFCAQSGARIRLNSMTVGTQGLFRPYLKTFVPPFLLTRLTAPGSPRMGLTVKVDKILGLTFSSGKKRLRRIQNGFFPFTVVEFCGRWIVYNSRLFT